MNSGRGIVLLYHRIGSPLVRSTVRGQYVLPAVLRRQLLTLLGRGFQPISLAEAAADPVGAEGRFAVTFDDGYSTVVRDALPVLADLKVPATIFVVAGQIGGTNLWDQLHGDRVEALMNGDQIRECAAAGIEIGSHTMTHARLAQRSDKEMRAEVFDSKRALEDLLGRPVESFSYPYGAWDARVRDTVIEAGYKYAVAATLGAIGPEIDLFAIPRVNIRWNTVGWLLRRKIRGAQEVGHADS